MKIGWLEWDEVIGPAGKVYAEGAVGPLPTVDVRWEHLCLNRPEGCQGHYDAEGRKIPGYGEGDRTDDNDFQAVLPLENGMYAMLLASFDPPLKGDTGPRTWSIALVLANYWHPDDPHEQHAPEKHIVRGITRTEPPVAIVEEDTGFNSEYMVDPEDYDELLSYLRLWSRVVQPSTDEG